MSLSDLVNIFKDFIQATGYFGIFLGTFFIDSFILPIPNEIFMGFAGFLVREGKLTWFGVILAAVLGNAFSSALIWWLGNKYGKNFILRWGHYVGFDEVVFAKIEKLFNKYGYPLIFVCQLIPPVRSLISIPAGVLKTKFVPFMICTVSGATIWLTFMTYVGYILGENWETIGNIIKPFEKYISYFLILEVFVGIAWWIYHLRTKKPKLTK